MIKTLKIIFLIGLVFSTFLVVMAATIWKNDVEFSPALFLTESWKFLGITMGWSVVWYTIQRHIDNKKKDRYKNTLGKMIKDTIEKNNNKEDIENSIFCIRNFICILFSNCHLSIDETQTLNQLDTDLNSKDCNDALESINVSKSRHYISNILNNYIK